MLEIVLNNVLSFPFFEVKVVVGFKEDELRGAIEIDDPRLSWVTNERYNEGLSTSIKAALNSYNGNGLGMLVFLGDQPLIKQSTIQQMISTIVKERLDQTKCTFQPIYNETPGHPVYLSPQMIPYLETITGDRGAKAIFHLAEKQIYIPVEDEGIFFDFDTKKDYLRYLGVNVNEDHRDRTGGII